MTEKNSLQHSAVSCQFFANIANRFAEDVLTEAGQPGAANTRHPCRIVCDETPEDFRLTLCHTLCAGACPRTKEFIHKNPCESVAAFTGN